MSELAQEVGTAARPLAPDPDAWASAAAADLVPDPAYAAGGLLSLTIPADLSAAIPSRARKLSPDEAWMSEALRTAMGTVGLTSPNPTVGCVIVKQGRELARGATEPYGGRHAEQVALARARAVSADLSDAEVFVTLEPCSHQGKQPPCVEAILAARPSRCVVGLIDPDPRVQGRGVAALRRAGIPTTVGVLRRELQHWHMPFLASAELRRPIVIAKWAQTLDGQLCMRDANDGPQSWISGPPSRAYTHWLRQKYDAIVVGAGTVVADRPSLTVRDCASPIHRNPLRIVHDPRGRLLSKGSDALCSLASRDGATVLLRCAEDQPDARGRYCASQAATPPGLQVIEYPAGDALSWLRDEGVIARLSSLLGRPLQSVMVEGGPTFLAALFQRNLVDWAHVFIATAFGGGVEGRIGVRMPPGAGRLHPVASLVLGHDVVVDYAAAQVVDLLARRPAVSDAYAEGGTA